jgi:Glycosyl transferases group 1
MKRVLVLAYYFPPIGGAGAQRPAKLVRYLPAYGIEPVVVTGPGSSVGRWTPTDETLSYDVAPSTEIHRVPGEEPPSASGWRSRGERWVGLPAKWSTWWVDGVVELGRQIPDVDLIYAWMSPYSSAVAAARLSEELGKPWVADLGDPWALDEMMIFPSAVHRRRELARMRQLLGSAAAIVMSTPEAALRVRQAFPELAGKPIVSIPNGFDASDFEGSAPVRDDGVFRIVHTGYLHTELGRRQRRTAAVRRLLGGETRGVDILTRSHVYLLEAIDRLIERDSSLRDRIEVHLAGVLSNTDREIASRSGVVRLHGYLPHAESIGLIRSADLLFLPMQNLPPGTRSSTVPGKTYEYIASGRPILAAIPDGDARDILAAVGTTQFTEPADSSAIADRIAAEVGRWLSGEEPPQANWDVVARYERKLITKELAAVFDAVTALPAAGKRVGGRPPELVLTAKS